MSGSPQQFVCPQCGASRPLPASDPRGAVTCFVCGEASVAGGGPTASALPTALPAAGPSPGGPPPSQPLADLPTPQTIQAVDATWDAGDSWLIANAGWLCFLIGLCAVTVFVIVLVVRSVPPGAAGRSSGAEEGVVERASEIPPPQLTNARDDSQLRDSVRVKIAGAVWGPLRVKDERNMVVWSERPMMVIRFEATNELELALPYRGWREGSGAALSDSTGREYALASLSRWRRVQGVSELEELPPGEAVKDMIVFTARDNVRLNEIAWLRLRMPASAHGARGEYWFEIPSDMVESWSQADEARQ